MINVLGAGYYPAKLMKNLFSEKGPNGQLNLHVMGHFVFHAVAGIDAGVLGEHGGEGDFGHAGKADEVPTGEDGDVRDERLEGFESVIVMMMSRDGEPDEVIRAVVKDVTVEVVALLSLAGNAPSCGADEPMDLAFFAGNSNMDMFTTAFVEPRSRAELVCQFIAGCRFDVSPFIGIIGSTVNHGRRDAPFSAIACLIRI